MKQNSKEVLSEFNNIILNNKNDMNDNFCITHPATTNVVLTIEKCFIEETHMCTIFTDVFCGKTNLLRNVVNSLQKGITNNPIVLNMHFYGHATFNTKYMLTDILTQIGHALANVGGTDILKARLTKYLVYLSVINKKTDIVCIISDAQNIRGKGITLLIDIAHDLWLQNIYILFVIEGETMGFKDWYNKFLYNEGKDLKIHKVEVNPIVNHEDIIRILDEFDKTQTNYFFPSTNFNAFKLAPEFHIILQAFKEFAYFSAHEFVGVPFDILVNTIENCLKLNGITGLNHDELSKEDWLECINFSSYTRYLDLINR